MFHIGIAVQHPPLPDPSQLSELGIDFIRQCLTIDPDKRPTAVELMSHPWIEQFQEELGAAYEEESLASANGGSNWDSASTAPSSMGSLGSTGAPVTVFEEDEEGEEEEEREGALDAVQEEGL